MRLPCISRGPQALGGSDRAAAVLRRNPCEGATSHSNSCSGGGRGVGLRRGNFRADADDMPDRLPSLIVLVGFWIPPAVAGWVAAASIERGAPSNRVRFTYAVLAAFVLGYAVAWFYYNLGRMPPYVPGATMDPTFASPRAAKWLAVFTSALILPGSALACALAFWRRGRRAERSHDPRSPHARV